MQLSGCPYCQQAVHGLINVNPAVMHDFHGVYPRRSSKRKRRACENVWAAETSVSLARQQFGDRQRWRPGCRLRWRNLRNLPGFIA